MNADIRSQENRSAIMASVPRVDTIPERIVRSVLHRMGYRFRICRHDLPGSPDIVLPKYRTVIFVHGCFWHRHLGCKKTTTPKQNAAFWEAKFVRNQERDACVVQSLVSLGWKVVTLWECEVRGERDELELRIRTLLGNAR
jgi:DNA mismatch endonuclease (patch repair protein)